jgi:two-component system response regulator
MQIRWGSLSLRILVGILILSLLYLASLYSYNLFHCITEIFSIIIAFCIFVIVWDGAEALDFLFATDDYADWDVKEIPTLILLDLKLPKIDGLKVLQRIKSDVRTRFIPVVILTSSNEHIDMIKGYSSGANSYIRKPVDFIQFNEAVRSLGLYWLVLNEIPDISMRKNDE